MGRSADAAEPTDSLLQPARPRRPCHQWTTAPCVTKAGASVPPAAPFSRLVPLCPAPTGCSAGLSSGSMGPARSKARSSLRALRTRLARSAAPRRGFLHSGGRGPRGAAVGEDGVQARRGRAALVLAPPGPPPDLQAQGPQEPLQLEATPGQQRGAGLAVSHATRTRVPRGWAHPAAPPPSAEGAPRSCRVNPGIPRGESAQTRSGAAGALKMRSGGA